jgi:competence protein ComEC
MERRRVWRVLAVVALVALAGCTGALSGEAATPTATTDSPTAGSPTAAGAAATAANGTLSVHFINVGQGASVLVEAPSGETMLVDTGDWRDDGDVVLDYLRERGVDRIDYLVTSHADADHIGGHAAVIDYYETQAEGVGAVYDPGIASSSATYDDYLDAVEAHDVPLYETRAGDAIPLDGAGVDVLAPPASRLAGADANENSVVVRLAYGNTTFLLPGDGEAASEEYLLEEHELRLNATVLSAGHHGSESSSSADLLAAVTPAVAVVSSAYDSQYGHPHEAVLQRFAERSVRTYWTATHGTVRFTTNGSAVSVATQQAAPTAPLELRDGTPVEPGAGGDLMVRTVVHANGSTVPATTSETTVTDGGTTTGADEGTTTMTTTATESTGESALSVVEVNEDAPGDDNENPNGEYVTFENTGSHSLALGGWTVRDEADHTYTFPDGFELGPGEQVTLYTGSGTDTETALYWGMERAVWNNGGDTVTVRADTGTVVLREGYE